MARSTECPNCGHELNHLEGLAGRISICARCGWNRVVLARGHRQRERAAKREPLADVGRL